MKTLKKITIAISCILFVFVAASCMSTSSTQSKGHYNTKNLRNNARFEVKVADGVWWVPANSLGKTRYSDEEIAEMVNLSPEEKQAMISNLYEAIQLFQVSNYSSVQTNKRIYNQKTRIDWELHIDGYNAVRVNAGNCAGDTAWLNYILSGDYEEMGCIGWIGLDGGHVINYIKQDGYYYFIDMTHYRIEDLHSAVEDGNLESYHHSDFIQGNIHKAKSPEAFVDYCRESWKKSKRQNCLYYMHAEERPCNIGAGLGNIDFFPQNMENIINVVYYDGSTGYKYGFATEPEGVSYNWPEEEWPTPEIEPVKAW